MTPRPVGMNRLVIPVAAAFAAGLLPAILRADGFASVATQRPSLDTDFPVRLEDAYPVEFQDGYFKLTGRYADAKDGTDTTLVQPEIAYGFAPDVDVHLANAYLVGDGDRSGSGDLNLNVQYLFLHEYPDELWPAAAAEIDVIFPTGVGSDGVDLAGQINLTKTLVWDTTWDSLHVNLTFERNFVPAADERSEAYNAIVGYSRRLLPGTTFVTDVVLEKTFTEHAFAETAEVGLAQEIGDHVRLAGGIGVGLGDDAPDFTATVGVIVSK